MQDHQPRREEVLIAAGEAGERLDRVLAARIAELSRSRLKALILAGEVAIGGRTIRDPARHVNAGESVTVTVPAPANVTPTAASVVATAPNVTATSAHVAATSANVAPVAEAIALNIVYEDDAIIVLDKPKGLVVHPGAGNWSGTLVNALISHCGSSLSGIGGVRRPGIVHRLDKDTTGLMVVAKSDRAHQSLAAQFADHGRTGPLRRGYLAFVWGVPDRPKGTIAAPIDRHPRARDKMAVRAGGRAAVTHWEVLERYQDTDGTPTPVASLLACRLETGRTHQIRVHLAHFGHPLLGDSVYGPGFRTKAARLRPTAREALQALGRQALHAYLLAIEHPLTGEMLEFRSELPGDLARLRSSLGANPRGLEKNQ